MVPEKVDMNKQFSLLIVLLFLTPFVTKAQNLFLNPDFEEFEECPDSYSGINKSQCTDWKCIAGSPDYFNCSFYGVHAGKIFGTPSSGTGVVGMWGLINNLYCDGELQRESIAANLVEPLIPCETYRVTFDIRLDTAGPASNLGFGHDCLDFGFYFYKGSDPNVCGNSCGCWNVQPQVSIPSSWIPENDYITFSFEFIAEDNFDKVTVGPFCNENMFLAGCIAPQDNFGPFSLYFNVDNLFLEHIEKKTPIFSADTLLCSGNTLVLDASTLNAISYLWQDSTTLSTLEVFESGIYIVEIDIECALLKDTILVEYINAPKVNLGSDTTLCTGDTITLDVYETGGIYWWQDGSENERFDIVTSGEYWVEVKNECSTAYDTIKIIEIHPPTLDLEPFISICENELLSLDVTSPYSIYLWQDASTDPVYQISQQGDYWVRVSNNCGQTSDTISVRLSVCECNVYVPNIFTPNADDVNDKFMPSISCEVKAYELHIFNRWGELVYYSENLVDYWNGDYRDQPCNNGVYTYFLSYTTKTEETYHKYGDVTLVR